VAALVEDLNQRGQLNNTLLVISGEFGRTPKINGGDGRDLWAHLSTLAFAGGGLRFFLNVAASTEKVDIPKTTPFNKYLTPGQNFSRIRKRKIAAVSN